MRFGFSRIDRLLRAPVFVMGCPRSGTTFVGEVLGAHPRVAYLNEPPEIMTYTSRVFRGEASAADAAAFYAGVYRTWLARRRLWGVRRFVEKCPRHVFVLDFLARAFPRARFVHVVRDGRAVVSSLVKTGWLARGDGTAAGQAARYWVPDALRDRFEAANHAGRASLTWDLYVRAGLAGRALGPARYLELRYETLLAEPETRTAELLRFLGLRMGSAVREFLDRTRRDRDGAWRDELAPGDRVEVESTVGALLRELGYDANTSSGKEIGAP